MGNVSGRDMMNAVEKGNVSEVQRIINKNKSLVNYKDMYTPLTLACYYGCTGIVLLLLNNGADPNMKNEFGKYPLTLASLLGQTEIVKLLLNNGADPNMPTNSGNYPLTFASQFGRTEIVKLLLDRGANVNAIDRYGKSPLYYAISNHYNEIAIILRLAGATVGEITFLIRLPESRDGDFENRNGDFENRTGVKCPVCRKISNNNKLIITPQDNECPVCIESTNKFICFSCSHAACCEKCFNKL